MTSNDAIVRVPRYGDSPYEAISRDIRIALLQQDLIMEYYKMPQLKDRTAQTDDPLVLEWLTNARQNAGDFLKNLAEAALRADCENYRFVRPIVIVMRAKYPLYEASDVVKKELEEACRLWDIENGVF